ncbi:DUF2955 domain-containing protein [Microbulbifer magnicolonia]|uniref:DUF2955 domain-containing protein n=1 Tax=Microbulbifer magnicolonia TaxID=3109744 RepID=UPI002B4032D5|nr:DUF2955 domain-containing protein [Microbulbifer sp. GG15]
MPLAARRSYRLALSTGLALALCYGLDLGVPFVAPLFTVLLAAKPAPPPGGRRAVGLVLFMALALGVGELLGPLLQQVPFSALLLIALGVFFCSRLAIVGGRELPATLLVLGFTVIPAANSASPALAAAIVNAMVLGLAVAIASLWLVYPLFPEDPGAVPPRPPASTPARGNWLSLRATLIVLPAFAFTLTNPTTNLPFLVKSILLGREASDIQLRGASRELVGSTLLGGVCAVAVWWCLSLAVELWFFTAWVLLASLLLAGGTYQVFRNRMTAGFWVNTLLTMLILLGAAVQDSAEGKDVYQAFVVRMTLFLGVTVYAVAAMSLLEWLRGRAFRETLTEAD